MNRFLVAGLIGGLVLLSGCADSTNGSKTAEVQPLTTPPISDGTYRPTSLLYQFKYNGQQYNVTYQPSSGGTYQTSLAWQGNGVYRSTETGVSTYTSGSSSLTINCSSPHIVELTLGDDNCEMMDRSVIIQAGCGGGSSATPQSVCFDYSGTGFSQTATYSDTYANQALGSGYSDLKIVTSWQP